MKRLLAFVSLVAIATTASAPAFASETTKSESAPAHRHSSVAPADEYFGKLKMSVLGMRNTMADLGRKIDYSPEKAESIFANTDYLEDSIHDWQKKYPHDTWLPRYVLDLAHLYGKVPSDEGRNRAKKTMAWLVAGFPHSQQARVGRAELASGSVGAAAPPASGATPVTTNPSPQTSPQP